uniref:Uncharacterized protein n=1 Tax=Myoviridae sp. ctFv53 TaxID=2827670 RepID=A0A8S5T9D2_9CAUD|nr:MAG TPA: hypothetical protein [Myoviridae sp. ctFv53]
MSLMTKNNSISCSSKQCSLNLGSGVQIYLEHHKSIYKSMI